MCILHLIGGWGRKIGGKGRSTDDDVGGREVYCVGVQW